MATHIQVVRKASENGVSVLRRFSKLARSAGIVSEVKSRRYYARDLSELKRKERSLRRIEVAQKYAKLRKLGKSPEQTQKR